ncbi:hypothetical protein DPMN_036484 [Dreissena polymorpha]|uniref:Uncharacterized protein n=1 Tax=Dreissena polymorpha TaxID=45954 RepID=A0A9D4RLY6_DREPO|nr:hypothetical protein DPMN_036484 [Dreissena polymorpha]
MLHDRDVHNRLCARWLLHGCPQQRTCKLALTQMSTTDDVQASYNTLSTTESVLAGSDSDVLNRGRASWLLPRCPQQITCKLALARCPQHKAC